MTEVIYKQKGDYFALAVKGHANTDGTKTGSAVCTAVSILVQTLVQVLQNIENKGLTKYQANVKSGDVSIYARTAKGYKQQVNTMFEFAYIGLFLLSHEHPQYITVKTL